MSTDTDDRTLLPPGPESPSPDGLLPELRRDPLGLFTRMARECGGVARLRLGPATVFLVSEPAYVEQILVADHASLDKGLAEPDRLLGGGLLTSDGDRWSHHRRLIQPAFHRARLAAYAETMTDVTLREIEAWQPGEVRDLAAEMARLAMEIGAATLFGAGLGDDRDTIAAALAVCLEHHGGNLRSLHPREPRPPNRADRRFEESAARFDAVVEGLIARRRAGARGEDALSTLVEAADRGDLTGEEVRDEVATLLVAGFETTATGLAWTWHLLAQHPAVEARLHAELGERLDGRPPGADDHLPYAQATITEALRLYPPVWVIRRRSPAPLILGPYVLPAGAVLLMSQWVTGRDPRSFVDPGAFRPERWLDGLADRLPPGAFFPFGGGPRLCIGHRFGMLEATVIVATIAQRFRFRPVSTRPLSPRPLTTLRPRGGVRMAIERR